MKEKKIGPILLSGIVIGPILGSGIILLPPIIYQSIGDWAIVAWAVMMVFTYFFAYLFGYLGMKYPGDAGVTNAVEKAFGQNIKRLTSLFLIIAVSFGAVAVLLTAAKYINPAKDAPHVIIGILLLVFCVFLLSREIRSISTFSLILTTAIIIILFFGSSYAIITSPKEIFFQDPFSFSKFGYSLLLLFWIFVGWEIIGNYTNEMDNPAKTIPKAVLLSVTIIAIICLLVAAGIQWVDFGEAAAGDYITVATIFLPLFGKYSVLVIGVITAMLCVTTYLMIIGGVSRLVASQAEERFLPAYLMKRSRNNVPIAALLTLATFHTLVFGAIQLNMLTLDLTVAIANSFFLTNALICIATAVKIFPNPLIRFLSISLSIVFFAILLFSPVYILITIGILSVYFIFFRNRRTQMADCNG